MLTHSPAAPRPLRLPAAAVVATASVAFAAARVLDAWKVAPSVQIL
jgi:hypothetical protein